MKVDDLFRDVVVENVRMVWRRRDDKLSKHVIRQQDPTEVRSRLRFHRPDKGDDDT